jgi:hypothetical protein
VLRAALTAFTVAVALPPVPIPSLTPTPPPSYQGAPAVAHPVRGTAPTPRNPFMAANGLSLIHDDGWQTDAIRWGGPLGHSPHQVSSDINRDCGSITFDRRGRVLSVCVGASGPELYMFDPTTLATLDSFMLPPRNYVPSNVFQDYTGGGYFYLDNQDRVVTATTTRHIYVISEAPSFHLVRDYDLSGLLTSSEHITSALPDSHGLLWVVAKEDGVVLTLNFASGQTHVLRLGDEIENSFATDEHGGVYIATNRRLYRFVARGAAPAITWQVTYPNSGEHKSGQVDDGTGTTPTVMPGGYVNITDNADPMDMMVYRTAVHLRRGVKRQVCRMPIFAKGASADENSLIAVGRSMIAENNYGYSTPADVTGGKVSAPGFTRVDINGSGRGCHKVWTNTAERAPTVVSKLSLANGLIYTYTKDPGSSDPWYWTAIDFRTGRTVYKVLAGTGSLGYNNNYAGIALGQNRTEYLGTLGGIIALRDVS